MNRATRALITATAAAAFTIGAAVPAHAATPVQTVSATVNAATDTVSAGLWEGGVCKYLGKYIGPWGCRNR